MGYLRLLALGVLLCLNTYAYAGQGADEPPEVILGTNVGSAYGASGTPAPDEGAISHIDCIFSRLPYRHSVNTKPWRRAQQEVRLGALDGFFTAMDNPIVNEYATLSDPLVLEKWHWFTLADQPIPRAPQGARSGAILGSHQHLWFQQSASRDPVAAQNLPQLIKLLLAGRIEVVLADRDHFERAAIAMDLEPDRYHSRFFRYVALGVYFREDFLADQPGFMRRFNRAIPPCMPEPFSLSRREQAAIRQLLAPYLESWLASPKLAEALARHNGETADLTKEQIHRFDHQWRQAYAREDWSTLSEWLDADLVERFEKWQSEAGFVAEVIVTGRRGLNLATAPFASDYWQGDEAKFRQGINQGPGDWFVDEVEFDSSTRRFQTQISVSVRDETGQAVGVMTLGVDIEKALMAASAEGL